jgi:histidinol-phosphate phosphatase family protein
MRGCVVQYNPAPLPDSAPLHGGIAFLDRDGVLNIGSPEYINNPDEFESLNDAPQAVGMLRRAGYRICVVTNQSPILRGLWDEHRLHEIHNHMRQVFLEQDSDAHFDMILACPHRHRDRCMCRKPMPGMLRFGERVLRGDFVCKEGESIAELFSEDGKVDWWGEKPLPSNPLDCMVGDRGSDMGAGWAQGLRLFQVHGANGIFPLIGQILDSNNKGDDFHPVR